MTHETELWNVKSPQNITIKLVQLYNRKENLTGFTCKLSVLNMQGLLTNCDDVRGLLSNTWIIRTYMDFEVVGSRGFP